MQQQSRRDLTRWHVAAAVFWFEAIGLMGLGAAVLLSPFSCWGDRLPDTPAPVDDPCAAGEIPIIHDGVAGTWLIVLIAVGLGIAAVWVATRGHPRWRGVGLTVFGLLALVPIVAAATTSLALALIPTLWTGVPALLLLGSAFRLLTPPPDVLAPGG